MRRRAVGVLLIVALTGGGVLPSAWGRIGLVTIPARKAIRIKIDRMNRALVQEQRDVTVKAGRNRIEFTWPNMPIDMNTVQLLPLISDESVRVLSSAVPPQAPNTLVLEVESQEPREVPFRITYLMGGLSWQAEYLAVSDVDEKTLHLEASVTVQNETVEDYYDAEFELPVGEPFRQFIRSREGKKIVLFSAQGVPFEKAYTSDPEEFADAVAMHYVFRNDAAHRLEEGMLLPGKVRIFKQDATGSLAFLGEDLLPFVPEGDEIRLYVGPARDIEVERSIMSQQRQNIRRNKKGQIVAYDTEERYRVQVRNRKTTDAPLAVRVVLDGYWQMVEHSDPYERLNARQIEFRITVPAQSEKVIGFRVRGLNRTGGYVLSR